MAGLKVTLDAAMRARDVSRPTATQESDAELALPERLAARRAPAGSRPPDSAQSPRPAEPAARAVGRVPAEGPAAEDPAAGGNTAERRGAEPSRPRPGGHGIRRGPGRRPFRPGAAAEGGAGDRDRTAAAPDGPDREAAEPRKREPRTRRRYRLGRLADHDGQGLPAGPAADHGSGGSSPDCS